MDHYSFFFHCTAQQLKTAQQIKTGAKITTNKTKPFVLGLHDTPEAHFSDFRFLKIVFVVFCVSLRFAIPAEVICRGASMTAPATFVKGGAAVGRPPAIFVKGGGNHPPLVSG